MKTQEIMNLLDAGYGNYNMVGVVNPANISNMALKKFRPANIFSLEKNRSAIIPISGDNMHPIAIELNISALYVPVI